MKPIPILLLSCVCAVAQTNTVTCSISQRAIASAPYIQVEYRFVHEFEPFVEQNDKKGWPTNLVISTDYTNTIQLGTNYYRVVWETNVETIYSMSSTNTGVLWYSANNQTSFTTCHYSTTYTTNITAKIEEVK